MSKVCRSSAAYKMNDLDLVAVPNLRIGPVDAPYNHIIEFDSDSLPGQRKKLQQSIEIDLMRNFARFAVYHY